MNYVKEVVNSARKMNKMVILCSDIPSPVSNLYLCISHYRQSLKLYTWNHPYKLIILNVKCLVPPHVLNQPHTHVLPCSLRTKTISMVHYTIPFNNLLRLLPWLSCIYRQSLWLLYVCMKSIPKWKLFIIFLISKIYEPSILFQPISPWMKMTLLCMKTNSSLHGVTAFTLLMKALLLKEVHIPAVVAPPAPQPNPHVHVPTPPPKQESINAQSFARTTAAGEGLTCPPKSQCHLMLQIHLGIAIVNNQSKLGRISWKALLIRINETYLRPNTVAHRTHLFSPSLVFFPARRLMK